MNKQVDNDDLMAIQKKIDKAYMSCHASMHVLNNQSDRTKHSDIRGNKGDIDAIVTLYLVAQSPHFH